MRKLLFSLPFAVIAICSCTTERKPEVFIQPELDSILTVFVRERATVRDIGGDSIHQLIFFTFEGKQFFCLMSSNREYHSKYMNDCFEKNGKLITYYSMDGAVGDSLIRIPKECSCIDSLKRYMNWDNAPDMCYDYRHDIRYYMILSKGKYQKVPREKIEEKIFSNGDTVGTVLWEARGGQIVRID